MDNLLDRIGQAIFEPSRTAESRMTKCLAGTIIGWLLCIVIIQIWKAVI